MALGQGEQGFPGETFLPATVRLLWSIELIRQRRMPRPVASRFTSASRKPTRSSSVSAPAPACRRMVTPWRVDDRNGQSVFDPAWMYR